MGFVIGAIVLKMEQFLLAHIAGAIVVGINFAGAIVAGPYVADQLSPSVEELSQEQLSPEHMSHILNSVSLLLGKRSQCEPSRVNKVCVILFANYNFKCSLVTAFNMNIICWQFEVIVSFPWSKSKC